MVHKARSTVSEGCHGERVRFGLFQPPGQGQGKGGACAREFLVSDVYAPRAHGDTHLRPAPHQAAIPSARHRAAARSGGAPAALSPQPWVPPAAASLPWRRRQPRACRGSAAGHLACTRLSDSGCFSRVLRGASEEGVQSTSLIRCSKTVYAGNQGSGGQGPSSLPVREGRHAWHAFTAHEHIGKEFWIDSAGMPPLFPLQTALSSRLATLQTHARPDARTCSDW